MFFRARVLASRLVLTSNQSRRMSRGGCANIHSEDAVRSTAVPTCGCAGSPSSSEPSDSTSISKVPAAYLDVAVTKGATQWQLVRHVLFPVAKADIWDNLRAVYGVGWGWIILAEVVNAERGLGYLISISERRGHTAAIFAVILVIVLIAVSCDQLWRLGARFLFPYVRR